MSAGRFSVALLLVLAGFAVQAPVVARSPHQVSALELKPQMRGVPLQPHALYLLDKGDGAGRFQSVREIRARSEEFSAMQDNSFGYSTGVLWVRFRIKNPQSERLRLFLEYDFPPFDDIQVYRFRSGSEESGLLEPVARGGDRHRFSQREVDFRNVVFPFEQEAGSQYEYLLRLQTSSSLVFALNVYTGEELGSYIGNEQIVLGLYYGIMLAMVVTNLFFLVSTRDRTYLFYLLYILAYVLFQATLNGLTFQYLWPESVEWANNSLPFFIFLACMGILVFCRSFLNARQHTPGTDRLYWIVIVFNAAGLFSALFLFDYRINLIAAVLLTLTTLALVLANGIHTFVLGVRQSRFFLAAWALFLLGGGLNVLKSAGLLPDTWITTYGIQIGSALEVMVLSLGLGDRINQLSNSLQRNVKELRVARSESEIVGIRLRNLVEEADDFIFTLDELWNFTMVNKAFQRNLKYSQEEL
ncbi:MAG: hypothetical protein KDK23_00960, partial [Leptospiraceae bacterium]|nr:hypothetical protein [Leptospiraceae bacterium]